MSLKKKAYESIDKVKKTIGVDFHTLVIISFIIGFVLGSVLS